MSGGLATAGGPIEHAVCGSQDPTHMCLVRQSWWGLHTQKEPGLSG